MIHDAPHRMNYRLNVGIGVGRVDVTQERVSWLTDWYIRRISSTFSTRL